MKLTDLNPAWVACGGAGITRNGEPVPYREGIGISFNCPCGCGEQTFLCFENPLDGGPPVGQTCWQRTGEDFETLTLHPSIQRVGGCGYHGWVKNGEVTSA